MGVTGCYTCPCRPPQPPIKVSPGQGQGAGSFQAPPPVLEPHTDGVTLAFSLVSCSSFGPAVCSGRSRVCVASYEFTAVCWSVPPLANVRVVCSLGRCDPAAVNVLAQASAAMTRSFYSEVKPRCQRHPRLREWSFQGVNVGRK